MSEGILHFSVSSLCLVISLLFSDSETGSLGRELQKVKAYSNPNLPPLALSLPLQMAGELHWNVATLTMFFSIEGFCINRVITKANSPLELLSTVMYYCICRGSTSRSRQSWFACDTQTCSHIPMNQFGGRPVWATVSGNLWMKVFPWSWCAVSFCLPVLFLHSCEGWVHRQACKALLWAMSAVWARGRLTL